jgi:hypothetical protein
MFLDYTCTRNAQNVVDLFCEYFQGVYVRDNLQKDFVVDSGVKDSSTFLLIQLEEETVKQGILALTGRTTRVWVDNYLSETIYCHSGVPQGSHPCPLFFIADINDVLDIFENFRAFTYADDLK